VSRHNILLGKSGEEAAVNLLKEKGYKIIARNYKSKLGEIDIVAKDRDTLCFIEVKTRQNDSFGIPLESVAFRKQRQISKAALLFLKEKNLFQKKARFDVVSIINTQEKPRIELIKNAFDLDESFTY
jgi:putative endonuclease